jgi:Tol biopolymer transport system component
MAAGIDFIRSYQSVPEPELVPIPLTSYPGIEDFASFSPDGTQVAFTWCKDIEYKNCDIYVKQIGTEPPSPLTQTPTTEYSSAWSPDGLWVAFLRQLAPARSALVIIPQRGGRERVLAEVSTLAGEIRRHLAWTPDSQWLAFSDPERNHYSLFLISIKTGEKRRLTTSTDIGGSQGDSDPAFSPDGRLLAFTRTSQARDLYLLRFQKDYAPHGPPEKIRLDHLYNFDAAWTPDGDEIVFSSGQPAKLGLWRMPVGSFPRPRSLAFAPSDVSAPAVSRQGGRLAYTLEKFDTNIWRIDLPGPGGKPPAPAQFLSSTRLDYSPAYSRRATGSPLYPRDQESNARSGYAKATDRVQCN